MNDSDCTDEVYGCLMMLIYAILGIVVAVAVGIFFGLGFGILAYAVYLLLSLVLLIVSYSRIMKP